MIISKVNGWVGVVLDTSSRQKPASKNEMNDLRRGEHTVQTPRKQCWPLIGQQTVVMTKDANIVMNQIAPSRHYE